MCVWLKIVAERQNRGKGFASIFNERPDPFHSYGQRSQAIAFPFQGTQCAYPCLIKIRVHVSVWVFLPVCAFEPDSQEYE